MLAEQRGKSPITGREITDAVLDHCHRTGHVRGVLQRWENAVLGRLENWAGRLGGDPPVSDIEFLRGVADYLERTRANPTGVLYPTFKTEAEKHQARLLKARKQRAAARKAKKEVADDPQD
ncbi:DNA endonuclease VII [Ralstonia phage RsoP1IDN]|uniref:DNA endonuclease VII n=1 Tax=Ralstonia phage RsoP1IDN TaxID=2060091 RepID=A0A2P0VPF9_9CAUD|nr:endonuclease VII [Ralstonia phage RsoP1IDN]AUG85417.1 DNA endonuclease VII [Ralstonia phage RsoP1IDN]